MNWFDKTQLKKSFIKISDVQTNRGKPSMQLDWRGQSEDFLWFGDIQRYVFDSQTVKIFLSKTSKKWAVSLMTNHTYIGTCGFSIFWTFNLDQEKEAKETYKKVDKVARDTITEFIKEEKPTSIFYPTLRKRLKDVTNRLDVVKTNIPFINYSYDIPYEDDWRRTIYGPRYPKYQEESFKQYLNNSIYSGENAPTGKFSI